MKRIVKCLTSAVLLLLMTGCYFFPAEEELLDPPTVEIENVAYSTYIARKKTIEDKIIATGYVCAKKEYNASFPESGGTLKTICVTAGQYVEEGELLAELDTGNLDYLYKQQKLIVEKAELAYNSTHSETDRLDYEMERNTLEEYERQLGNARIYSGMAGQVCFTENMDPGTPVTAYKTIVKVVDPKSLAVKYTSSAPKAFPLGAEVTVTVDGTDYKGYVSKTALQVTEGLYEDCPEIMNDNTSIYCEFTDGLPEFLSVGSMADISAVFDVHENAVVISKNLVKTNDDGQTYVTVLDENENKKEVVVQTGIENATEIEIISGIKEGDKVVVR